MNHGKLMLNSLFLFITLVVCYFEHKIIYFVLFLLLHELGHILAGFILGYRFKNLQILPFGISMKFNQEFIKPGDDIIISISGPLINFIFFVIFDILCFIGYNEFTFVRNVNLILCIFNLLPAGFLDGGRILRNFLYSYMSFFNGYLLTYINGIILGCAIIFLGVIGGVHIKNIIIILMGAFIAHKSIIELKQLTFNIIKNITYKQNYIYGKKSFVIKQKAYNSNTKIFDIIKSFSYSRYYIIYMSNKDGIVFNLFESDIINIYYNYGNITFKECIKYLNTQEE